MAKSAQPDPSENANVYDLEVPAPSPPDLPGTVVVTPTVDDLVDLLAADLVVHAENCVREFGDFHAALNGDPTFDLLYRRLMFDPNYRRFPWRRTHLWFVNERCVPLEDDRSTYRLLRETIGDHADIPPEQFHPIQAESATADVDYESQIRETLGWREKGQDRLDYVLLSMSDEGATAGLVEPRGDDPGRLVHRGSEPDEAAADRVTLTPSFINAARFISILVTGASKAGAVRRLAGNPASADLPILGIAPMDGELKWYLDGLACGQTS